MTDVSLVTHGGTGGTQILDQQPGSKVSDTHNGTGPLPPTPTETLDHTEGHVSNTESNKAAPETATQSAKTGTHHALIDLPEIEVGMGEVAIAPDERAEIEAEAPVIAERVEDISEDRSWLSHKLLNVRTIFSFVLAFAIIV